jgi:23S rRNA pseudouridine1911/1915/1917 synthase
VEHHRLHPTPVEAGRRLDHYLDEVLDQYTRSRIKRLIVEGLVTVDGQTVKAGHPLKGGETVDVSVPPAVAPTPEPEQLNIRVIFEDDHLLVVNKRAGMSVHPGAGRSKGTLVNALLGRKTALSPIGGPVRPGIIHRLDKDTSGLLVVAKDEKSHYALSEDLAKRLVQRRYWALLWGTLSPASGMIEAPLARSRTDRRKMRVVSGGGKEARTRYRVAWQSRDLSVARIALDTGRTHQIRVHLKHLGNPVFGDPDYGGRGRLRGGAAERAKIIQALGILKRQALHACVLGFKHPVNGEELLFHSAPDEDIAKAARVLDVPQEQLSPGSLEDV